MRAAIPKHDKDRGGTPQAFVSRVEVVTGGASATHGSDAGSGVVIFIIDKNFNGIQATFVFVPNSGFPNEFYPSNQASYDAIGRYFVMGIRFRY